MEHSELVLIAVFTPPSARAEFNKIQYRVREMIGCRDKRIAEFLAVRCVQFTVAMLAQIDGQARRAK